VFVDGRQVFWSEGDLVRRLRRIEGQVRGVEAMVIRGAACRDVLTQLAAAQGALSKITRIVEACQLVEGLSETMPEGERDRLRDRLAGLIP
jgi:DNA-binding FrmR family transcriptional regulator